MTTKTADDMPLTAVQRIDVGECLGILIGLAVCLSHPSYDHEAIESDLQTTLSRVFDASGVGHRDRLTFKTGRLLLAHLCKEVLTYLGVKATYE